MKNFVRFVTTGYVFAIGVEIQYRLIGRFNPQALAAAIFLYPFILSFAWLGQKVIDKCVSSQLRADITCYCACGLSGLAVEWTLLGNSPAANPNAIQIGIFCLLIPAPQTRFVVIILVSVAAYIGMNVLLLWLMFRQHRNEIAERQVLDDDDDATTLAEVVEPVESE